MSMAMGNPEGSGGGSVLKRAVWPRTIRPMLAAALLPGMRGRMGQRAINERIAQSGLPAEIAAKVQEVTAKTRLWPSEREEVARELCSHFAEGMESGTPASVLMEHFGDAGQASKLIRAAKKRGRPAVYRAMVRVVQGASVTVVLLVLAYGYLAARFYLGSPTIKRNYAAELNKPILETPKEQRAWASYVEAVRAFGPRPEWMGKPNVQWPARAGDAEWPLAKEYLEKNARALELVREGAKRPIIGYVYSNAVDREYNEIKMAGLSNVALDTPQENPLMVGVLLPHLGEMRGFARALTTDLRVAVEAGDRQRALANVDAMLGMAEQTLREQFMISNLVGLAIGSLAANETLELLARPGFFDAETRKELAHRFAGFGGGRVSLNAEFERVVYADMVQRVFSDNGKGDGHMVFSETPEIYRDFGMPMPGQKPFMKAALPVVTGLGVSRKELMAQVDRFANALARDDGLPPQRHGERTSGLEQKKLMDMCTGPMSIFADFSGMQDTTVERVFWTRDVFELRRQAVLTACALESYKERTGGYPATLDALVPEYLPRVPMDLVVEAPVKYVVKDGKALVYSIGTDGKDDGGRVPANGNHVAYERFDSKPRTERDMGDWVVYPMPADRKD